MVNTGRPSGACDQCKARHTKVVTQLLIIWDSADTKAIDSAMNGVQ
jgi:hypothetical protein